MKPALPPMQASTVKVLNALVDKHPRFLTALQVHGAADVSVSTARAACCELVRRGLAEKRPIPPKFNNEAPTMTYGARTGVQVRPVPLPVRHRTPKLLRPAYEKVRAALLALPPGCQVADVARETGLDISTVGTALRDLLEAGEVTREQGQSAMGGQRPWLWSRVQPAEVAACL